MKKTLYILAAFVVAVGVIALAVLGIMGYKWALYVLIGLAFNYVLSTLMHESGHLIVGKIRKMKFAEGSFLFFNFYRKGKQLKVKLSFSSVAGEVELVSDKPDNAFGDLVAVSLSSLIFTLLYISVCLIIGFAVGTLFSKCFLVYANLITLYMFLINALPVIDTNDGSVFFGLIKGDKDYISHISLQRIVSYLYNGLSPKEIPETEFVAQGLYADHVKYYRFLALLDGGYYEKAYLMSAELISVNKEFSDRVLAERLFIAIKLNLTDEIEKIKELALSACFAQEAFALRVSGAYRLFNGETDWGRLCIASAQKLAKEEYLKGLGVMEVALTEKVAEN